MPEGTQFTDGIVIDHVAEFAYYPTNVLRELYALDPVGYIDGIGRFIQIVATAPKLLFCRNIQKEETARLRDELAQDGRVDDTSSAFAVSDRSERATKALVLVHQHWPDIEKVLRTEERAREAIRGHVLREFRNCYLASDGRQQDMSHYVAPAESKQLSEPLRSSLLEELQTLRERSGKNSTETEQWLDRTITTQYRVYFEHALYSVFDYTPAVTRCDLTFTIRASAEEPPVRAVSRCIAAKVLEEVQKAGGRDKLIPCLLEWCNKPLGVAVTTQFAELRSRFRALSADERTKALEDIDRILGSQVGFLMGLALGFTGIWASLEGFGEPDSKSVATTAPLQLRWLWHLRQPDVLYRLGTQVEDLLAME